MEPSHTFEQDVVYLNNAGQARFSKRVQDTGVACVQQLPWNMHAQDDQVQVRSLFARLLQADARDIAIMPSTAFATTLAAENLARQLSGQTGTILLLQDQFTSAVYPWQKICKDSDGTLSLDVVPYPKDGENWTTKVLHKLKYNEAVRVACLPPLHWSDGSLLDLEGIAEICRRQDIPLIVDATQAAGIYPLSVAKIKPTLLACSVHKWLRGPSGTSLVYLDQSVQSVWQPLDQHERGRYIYANPTFDAARNNMSPQGYDETFFSDARKFDCGGKANPILIPMLRAALEEVVALDLDCAQRQLKEVMLPLIHWAQLHDFKMNDEPYQAYHLVGLRPCAATTDELLAIGKKLQENGIVVALRCGGIRVSPYLDTTATDIAKLISTLEAAIA